MGSAVFITARDDEFFPVTCRGETEWQINTNPFAKGQYSAAYTACCRIDCEYVARITVVRSEAQIEQDYKNELENQETAAKFGLTIPILDKFDIVMQEKNAHVVIMPKLTITLYDYLKLPAITLDEFEEKILTALKLLRQLAYKANMMHGDPHLANFMLDQKKRMYLIDFGMSQIIPPPQRPIQQERAYLSDAIYMLLNMSRSFTRMYHILVAPSEAGGSHGQSPLKSSGRRDILSKAEIPIDPVKTLREYVQQVIKNPDLEPLLRPETRDQLAKQPIEGLEMDSFELILKTLCELQSKLQTKLSHVGDIDAKDKAEKASFGQLEKNLRSGELGNYMGMILYRPVELYQCQFFNQS